MYWWKELLFVSSYKVCFLFQNFVSCSVSYNINWIVTQIGFFPGPHICSKALTGVGRGITSPFHGDFYFNFHLSWLMCKSWMLQRLEKLICLVRSFSMSCDIFDLHICQDRWKLENWCLLLTQVDCRNVWIFLYMVKFVCVRYVEIWFKSVLHLFRCIQIWFQYELDISRYGLDMLWFCFRLYIHQLYLLEGAVHILRHQL